MQDWAVEPRPRSRCIVAIGLDNSIGNKGRIDATITVRGRAGHSSLPWRASNAIAGAVEVLRQLGPHLIERRSSEYKRNGTRFKKQGPSIS